MLFFLILFIHYNINDIILSTEQALEKSGLSVAAPERHRSPTTTIPPQPPVIKPSRARRSDVTDVSMVDDMQNGKHNLQRNCGYYY